MVVAMMMIVMVLMFMVVLMAMMMVPMTVPMGVAVSFDLGFPFTASAYRTHGRTSHCLLLYCNAAFGVAGLHSTSSSLIFISSPPVTCS
jgi:hypothetical protein